MQVKQTTPSVVSQTYVAVTQLAAALASEPDANRVINYSLVLVLINSTVCNLILDVIIYAGHTIWLYWV